MCYHTKSCVCSGRKCCARKILMYSWCSDDFSLLLWKYSEQHRDQRRNLINNNMSKNKLAYYWCKYKHYCIMSVMNSASEEERGKSTYFIEKGIRATSKNKAFHCAHLFASVGDQRDTHLSSGNRQSGRFSIGPFQCLAAASRFFHPSFTRTVWKKIALQKRQWPDV